MKVDIKNEKKRVDWIDYLKAIGIFLVCLGHSNCVLKLRKYVYSFHMPLFFLIGGLTINPAKYGSIKEFFIYKVKKLLIPYFCINLFTIPFWYIYCEFMVNKSFSFIEITKGIFISNNDITILVNGPTWFITTLFLSEMLFYLLYKFYDGDKKHLLTVSIFLLIIGYIEGITSRKIVMPWHINSLPVGCALTIIGYLVGNLLIKSNFEKLKKKSLLNILMPVILMFCGAYLAIFVNGNVSFGGNNYKSFILTFSSLFMTICGLSMILMQLPKIRLLSFVGKSSLVLLAIHKPAIYIIRYYIPVFKTVSIDSTIIGTLMFLFLIPVAYIIKKFAPFLVGDFNIKK